MKRALILLLTALMVVTCFTACKKGDINKSTSAGNGELNQAGVIKIGGMKGATTIGMLKVMNDSNNDTAKGNYNFRIETDAAAINPLLIKGDLDMAALPANAAATLYNKTNGAIEVLAINTLGLLYILETGNTIESVSDLKGKTICATGKGTTPEFALRYILSKNGIDPDNDVSFDWKSEASEVLAALKKGVASVAMLPQPFATVAQSKVDSLNVALDLNEEWNKTGTESMLVTGVLVARKEFVENNPELVKQFLEEYKASIEYVNNNASEASVWINETIGVEAAAAEAAIPYCNLSYIDGSDMKSALKGYLDELYSQDPNSVGGKVPTDDFYYEG